MNELTGWFSNLGPWVTALLAEVNWFWDSNLEPWLLGSLIWLSTRLGWTGVAENWAGF
jgi:hypothetical protein